MNIKQAMAKVRKVLGPNGNISQSKVVSSQERRQAAHDELNSIRPKLELAEEAMKARRAEILNGDETYQRLNNEWKALRDAREKAIPISHHYQFRAGTASSLFFSVKAQADSLQELVQKVEALS